MNFIALPSGLIINMSLVAFIHTGVEGGRKVSFSAAYATAKGCVPMSIELEKADADAMLNWLQTNCMKQMG